MGAVLVGGFDIVKSIEEILNVLISKGTITREEGQDIINNATGK